MRSFFSIVALTVLCSCDIPVGITLESEFTPQFPTESVSLVGFPREKVDLSVMDAFDSTYGTTLAPGDSFSVYLVGADFPYATMEQMKDTIRHVTWTMTPYTWGPSYHPDSSIATLRTETDGRAVVTVHKPSWNLILHAGSHRNLMTAYSCDAKSCVRVSLMVPER